MGPMERKESGGRQKDEMRRKGMGMGEKGG